MQAKYINPYIIATVKVLDIMASMKIKAQKPYLKKDNFATGDVSTIVGLTGQSSGTFSISFEQILRVISHYIPGYGDDFKPDRIPFSNRETKLIQPDSRDNSHITTNH